MPKGAWQSVILFRDGFPRLLRSLGMTRVSELSDIGMCRFILLFLLGTDMVFGVRYNAFSDQLGADQGI